MSNDELTQRNRKDIDDLKHQYSRLDQTQQKIKEDIQNLKFNDTLQDREIKALNDTLNQIQSDTRWIRRRITGAIITAVVTVIVTSFVGYAILKIYGI